MSYLARFLEPSNSAHSWGEGPTKPTKPAAAAAEDRPADPLAHLRGPHRTAWGSLARSDPAAPPLELFGPPDDDVRGPVSQAAIPPDPWKLPVPRQEGAR